MSEAFKLGDVVRLKSGGPQMTVQEVGTDMAGKAFVLCVWFEENTKRQDDFSPESLEPSAAGRSVGAIGKRPR